MRFAATLALVGGTICAIAQYLNSNFEAGGVVCSVKPPSTVIVTKKVTVFTTMEATATATSFTLPSSSGIYYFSAENGTTVWYGGISPSETALIVLQTSTIEVTEVPASSTTGMTSITTQITTATRIVTSTVTLTSSEVLSSDEAIQSTIQPSTVTILGTTTQTAFVALAITSTTTDPSNTTSINTTSTQANETIVVTEMNRITHTTTAHSAFTRPIFGWNVTSPSQFNNTTLLTVFSLINKPNMTLANGTAT
jgi:hypothetical protein